MALKTVEEYLESIRDDREVYLDGRRVEDVTEDPVLKKMAVYAATDYAIAQDPDYQDLVTETLDDGDRVHFVFVPPKSTEDLMRRREIIKLVARVCLGKPGGAKFTGIDGINGVALACRHIDRKIGTDYSARLEKFRRHCMDIDAAVSLCMTDVKGNRSLHPHKQQGHQDYYLRIVSSGEDGIVIRGAKVHISNTAVAHEMVVLPCRAMRKEDRDYAVACAVPINTKGLKIIGNAGDGVHPMIVFDDVFVPTERIFLAGEWEYAAEMPYMFSTYHRLSADTYKYAELELMIGAAGLMAEYNGLESVSHIRDKLAWLVMYAEGTEALGKAAVQNCELDADSGYAYPNTIYSNVAKFFFANQYHEAEKHLQDIAGGLVSTLPSMAELDNPETSKYIKKYLGINEEITAEKRMRLFKYIQHLCSYHSGNVTVHAEGSLAAQRLTLYRMADWDRYKAFAKRACGIETDHPEVVKLPNMADGSLW
jgi:4-hydroxybutyryl-CoA dehydratase/vinylacetyl-CoA-Delta-isomerase